MLFISLKFLSILHENAENLPDKEDLFKINVK